MLLLIDIGNTSTKMALYEKDHLIDEGDIPTSKIKGLNVAWRKVDRLVVSSVVPEADKVIYKKSPVRPFFVDYSTIPLIKIKVDRPSEVGADRLVNAYAGYRLYGGPLVILDFGTATTFDVISENGEYRGGAISMGLGLAKDILYERTAKLPRVEIELPQRVVGTNTEDCLKSGLVFGYQSLVEGMVKRFLRELPKSTKVVATGGYALLVCQDVKCVQIINPTLTIEGLRMIAKVIKWKTQQ